MVSKFKVKFRPPELKNSNSLLRMKPWLWSEQGEWTAPWSLVPPRKAGRAQASHKRDRQQTKLSYINMGRQGQSTKAGPI